MNRDLITTLNQKKIRKSIRDLDQGHEEMKDIILGTDEMREDIEEDTEMTEVGIEGVVIDHHQRCLRKR